MISLITYSPDELWAMVVDHTPARAARKTLFTLHLWQPVRYRRPPAARASAFRVGSDMANANHQPADPALTIGWPNGQSLGNKT